jgi:hypothetical protein
MTENLDLSERSSESQKKIGRSVAINGVHAVDLDIDKATNLNDPILNINLKVNNPLGRLWLALQRIWKSQSTVIALRFTIPLLVLPIALYVGWRLWQGRGVITPITKLGVVHAVKIAGTPRDIFILPSADVYLLTYTSNFEYSHRLVEKPVIVVGTYSHLDNTVTVEDMIAYNEADMIVPAGLNTPGSTTLWQQVIKFIDQFR